jgi:uncharacterized surface protein with fasciclin (FAS1) repeats
MSVKDPQCLFETLRWQAPAPVEADAYAKSATAMATPAAADDGATIAGTAIAVSSLDGFDGNNGDFDMLIQALIAADLVGTVDDPVADLTVFAPTDQAFVRLARDLGYAESGYDEPGPCAHIVEQLNAIGEGDPIPVLTDMLLYHVSPGSTFYGSLRGQVTEIPTLVGASITAEGRTLVDAAPSLKDPRIRTRSPTSRPETASSTASTGS